MVALALFSTLCTIAFAWGLSAFITKVFDGETPSSAWPELAIALAAGASKGAGLWMQELLAANAAISVKRELRQKYMSAMERLGPAWVASQPSAKLTSLATSGLDALDAYFSRYLPQLFFTAIATPILVLVIAFSDLTSSITLIATIPLVPIFMILIGLLTRQWQTRQLSALHRLNQYLSEVLKGITTLRIFGRAEAQSANIKHLSNELRSRTMKILRITFLSGFALELISSLSVALIAVSIGLRLVNSDLAFSTGLFVLLLAPEAFLPIRAVGANFHAATEGVEASGEILDAIDSEQKPAPCSVALPANGVTWLSGPSGAGKSTYLRNLLEELGFDRCAWMPQQPLLSRATVLKNIVGPVKKYDEGKLAQALELAALDDLDLDRSLAEFEASISGGQAQRISLARTFYRALTNQQVNVLLLDEPISALDAERAKTVRGSIRHLADLGLAVVVASHQEISADHSLKIAVQHA